MRAGESIPDPILKEPVAGVNLAPGPLGDQLGDGPTLLVCLRHFGCIFCRRRRGRSRIWTARSTAPSESGEVAR